VSDDDSDDVFQGDSSRPANVDRDDDVTRGDDVNRDDVGRRDEVVKAGASHWSEDDEDEAMSPEEEQVHFRFSFPVFY
jgi:hypothetical protein